MPQVLKLSKQRTAQDWVFVVFMLVAFPVMFLLGYYAYQSISELALARGRVVLELQVQELEHRIRAEQGRECILDGIDAIEKGTEVPRPTECEAPDLDDLMDTLERAKAKLDP